MTLASHIEFIFHTAGSPLRPSITRLDLHETRRIASCHLEGIRPRRRRLDHSRDPHEDASAASRPAGAASHRHPGSASHAHGAIRIALSRRALPLAAAFGKHAQRGSTTAWIRQGRHVQPWLQGGGIFASQRMWQMECRRHQTQLAHVEANAVRKVYARAEYWAERVEMMAYWADRLDELRRGGIVMHLRA